MRSIQTKATPLPTLQHRRKKDDAIWIVNALGGPTGVSDPEEKATNNLVL